MGEKCKKALIDAPVLDAINTGGLTWIAISSIPKRKKEMTRVDGSIPHPIFDH